jgi:GLPGLI family protein
MKKIFSLIIILFSQAYVHAQQFISKAVIEYEVRSNIKKTMGNGTFDDMIKDQIPQFKTGYYNFTFADNKSIYQFDHWDEQSKKVPQFWRKSDEENVWYYDYNTGKYNM